ncbi:MAG: DUF3592 domain-containing protein [Verrucomicrobia bacterium]|nr:DUF3592 domain-containing protein [Verrucomicrobiota bacterium]
MPLFVLMVCATLFLAGLAMTTRSGCLIWSCLRASRWPTATARLLSVDDQDVSGPEDTNHRIRVCYDYEVDGECHEGNVIHPCYAGGSRFGTAHSELLTVLHPGRHVRVRYNPDQPDQSMLSAGFHLRSVVPLLLGLELLLFSTAIPTRFGWSPALGTSLFLLCGCNLALILLVLLIGSERFASGIVPMPSR